jgi:hypothetical protein
VRRSTVDAGPGTLGSGPFVFLAFAALAVFWTWPVAANISSGLPHDGGDPVLNTWILWWNARVVPFTAEWWNAPFFWPLPDTLALSEHLAGLSVFATPPQLAGASPIAAYNVCFLLSFALSGFFGYLLAYHLTGSALAAMVAGVAFGFSPYRASQLSHIQVLTSYWMPLALWALHAYLDNGSRRWLLIFAAAWLLQAQSNGYYMLFFPVVVVIWLAWFVDWRHAPRRGLTIAAVWILASLPLLPVLMKYRAVHTALGISRDLGDIRQFSALPVSFLQAPAMLAIWPEGHGANPEQYLFPGVTAIALAAIGLTVLVMTTGLRSAWVGRSPLLFYLCMTIALWTLALGPGGQAGESPSALYPYSWLLVLPGFDGLRAPARIAMLGSLTLAVAASLSLVTLPWLRGGRRTPIGYSLTLLGLLVDGLMHSVPVVTPPPRVMFAEPRDSVVLELPIDDARVNLGAMFRSMRDERPLVNGYSGYVPPHFKVLSLSLGRGDPSALRYVGRGRPVDILVDDAADRGRGFRPMIESLPGIERRGVTSLGSVFRLPAQPSPARAREGSALPASLSDSGRFRLVADLGQPRTIEAIEFPLRSRYEDLAARLLIEVSEDALVWSATWDDWTGGPAFEATLADPHLATVTIPLPAVKARFLRIYPAAAWMKTDLVVVGRP